MAHMCWITLMNLLTFLSIIALFNFCNSTYVSAQVVWQPRDRQSRNFGVDNSIHTDNKSKILNNIRTCSRRMVSIISPKYWGRGFWPKAIQNVSMMLLVYFWNIPQLLSQHKSQLCDKTLQLWHLNNYLIAYTPLD